MAFLGLWDLIDFDFCLSFFICIHCLAPIHFMHFFQPREHLGRVLGPRKTKDKKGTGRRTRENTEKKHIAYIGTNMSCTRTCSNLLFFLYE